MGGRGATGETRGGGAAKAEAQSRLNSLKPPKMGQSVSLSYNGKTGTITRVKPGYVSKSGSNTMYSVAVEQGDNVLYQTNRRGSTAFSEAKSDLRLYLGLK